MCVSCIHRAMHAVHCRRHAQGVVAARQWRRWHAPCMACCTALAAKLRLSCSLHRHPYRFINVELFGVWGKGEPSPLVIENKTATGLAAVGMSVLKCVPITSAVPQKLAALVSGPAACPCCGQCVLGCNCSSSCSGTHIRMGMRPRRWSLRRTRRWAWRQWHECVCQTCRTGSVC